VKYNRHRRDENDREVVRDLEAAHCSVVDLTQVGGGCPDKLVGRDGVTLLVEIKRPTAPTRKDRTFSQKQRAFRRKWKGTEIVLVTTARQVIEAIDREIEKRGY